jgi:hypothetical protein
MVFAQRLDVAHRQAAHERADHHRLERLGAQQLCPAQEQPRDERLGGLADLRDLHRQLALRGLLSPWTKAVAQSGDASGRRSYLARPSQASNSSSTAR